MRRRSYLKLFVILFIVVILLQIYILSRDFGKSELCGLEEQHPVFPQYQTTKASECVGFPETESKLASGIYIALMTKDRPQQLQRTLSELICKSKIHYTQILVFSDADDQDMIFATQKACSEFNVLVIFDLARDPVSGKLTSKPDDIKYRLTKHYQFAFNFTFGLPKKPQSSILHSFFGRNPAHYLIIMEDDLSISPDFGQYFSAAALQMNEDGTVFCTSAWNDNAYPATGLSPKVVKRGRHFMALGWMMSAKNYFHYIFPGWTASDQDTKDYDWDRLFLQAMFQDENNVCLFPEVPRTHHRPGDERRAYSTSNVFQKNRLDSMVLASNENFDCSLLANFSTPKQYDEGMKYALSSAIRISSLLPHVSWYAFKTLVYYCEECDNDSEKGWNQLLDGDLGLFGTGFDGVVRGVYKDVVSLRLSTNLVYIVGKNSPFAQTIPTAKFDEARDYNPAFLSEEFDLMQFEKSGTKSCLDVCKEKGLYCHEQAWSRINSCVVLKKNFECSKCSTSDLIHAPLIFKDGECRAPVWRNLQCSFEKETDLENGAEYQRICACISKDALEQIRKL